MAGLKLRIPSIQSVLTLMVTLALVLTAIRVLPLPENFKSIFRV